MSDADQTTWAQHAASEGAAISADPGEAGDVTTPLEPVPDGAEPQPETGDDPSTVGNTVGEPPKDTNASGLVP